MKLGMLYFGYSLNQKELCEVYCYESRETLYFVKQKE